MPSNISDVIDAVKDTRQSLEYKFRRKLRSAMRKLEADVRTYIKRDADYRGNLARSVSLDSTTSEDLIRISVSAGGPQAPYAPFVEFGTGDRTNQTTPEAPSSQIIYEPGQTPPNFPYESPDMSPGLVANIVEWVATKPVDDDAQTVGFQIASVIVNKGTYAHPYLRPAWFENEVRVKRAAEKALHEAVH